MKQVLDGHELTKGLSKKEIMILSSCLERKEFKPADSIMEENKIYRSIFFIEKGNVSVIKTDSQTGHEFSIAELKEKECFGEMSFISQDEPASATVRAKTTAVIWILRKKAIRHLSIYYQLVINISQLQRDRIRATNEKYVKSLSKQLAQVKASKEFGMLFIITIILFGMQYFIEAPSQPTPVKEVMFTWIFLILDLLPFVYLLWKMKYPLRTYGVTSVGWEKSTVESLCIVGVVSFLFILYTYITKPGEPLFPFTYVQGYPISLIVFYFASYLFHCSLQEFITRGVIQGSLHKFMTESHFIVPIFVSAMVFGICHLHKGLQLALFTFVISFVLGALYYRHKTLIGVTITHFFLGALILAMGYM